MNILSLGVNLCFIGFITIGSSLMTGCRGSTANIVEGIGIPAPAEVPYSYAINNKKLARTIEVTRVDAREIDGLLQAQVTVRNRTKKTARFEYRVEWFDKDGFEITSPVQPWKPEMLYGKMEKILMVTATSPEAKRYRVALRFPQKLWK